MGVNLKSLVGKLNDTMRLALEGAAGLCLARTHYDIEIEHVLAKLLDIPGTDAARIFHNYGADRSRLESDVELSLQKLKSGNARTPAFSPSLIGALTDAWTLGSLDFGESSVRSGHFILALLTKEERRRIAWDISAELQRLPAENLMRDFASLTAGQGEGEPAQAAPSPDPPKTLSKLGPNLQKYTVNLTENARKGKIDPVLGRDPEIRQVIDILMRRRQNNPILTGEAGVGKTAIVEGFALRVAQGLVPPALRYVEVLTLDLGLLQAGAGIKGEFENRLKTLIEEAKSSPTPIILFIDEAHAMIGAGGQAGQNDAANLLKPALARGELRTIAATTWTEYKKYFERDPALARRFQVVKVEEPEEQACIVMLRGIRATLERHHGVRILEEAVTSAVRLSHRYIAGRQLPDKAVSVLDTACARIALGQNSLPAAIEDTSRELEDLAILSRALERESAAGTNHSGRLVEVAQRMPVVQQRLGALEAKFAKEKELVTTIRDLRTRLEEDKTNSIARTRLDEVTAELERVQEGSPLIRVCVDSHTVGEVISAWTGIPVGKMLKDDMAVVLGLDRHLGARIVGQGHALEQIAHRIRTSRAGLEDPNKPVGVFLLTGPSGVGKTETALALADAVYGGERNIIGINMSEFHESHTVSTLKGSPPGYIGYGEGGVLTEAVRRKPYSVVLLDEAEKAHRDVLELFLQVFDRGVMEDGEGREVDFRNTILILTSNVGAESIQKLADQTPNASLDELLAAVRPDLAKAFPPAFLGRLVVVPYLPIRDQALRMIINGKLRKIQLRLEESHRVNLTYDNALVEEIAARCTEVESGARNVDNILTHTLLPRISRDLLAGIAENKTFTSIHVGPNWALSYA
jgi:type VI secretion system protein VasG